MKNMKIYYCENCGYNPNSFFDCVGRAVVEYKVAVNGDMVIEDDDIVIHNLDKNPGVTCSSCLSDVSDNDMFFISEELLNEANQYCFNYDCSVFFITDSENKKKIISFTKN